MKKSLFVTAFALVLTGCAGGQGNVTADPEYMDLVFKAEKEIKLASDAGYTWRDTEKFLADSRTAMKAGDRDTAMKLAKKALKQAQLAQQQAKDNSNPQAVFK